MYALLRKHRRLIIPIVAAWWLYGLASLFQSRAVFSIMGRDAGPWVRQLVGVLVIFLLWPAFTLAIMGLARRFPLRAEGRRLRHGLVHLSAALAVTLLDPAFSWVARRLLLHESPSFAVLYLQYIDLNLLLYFVIAAVVQAIDSYRMSRDRETRAAILQHRLATAQLALLKLQVQPHFLFNTLNTIASFIRRDADVAERMTARLGDLLRLTLEMGEDQEVPLYRELELLSAYLDIERVRFGEWLQVRVRVAPEVREALVPGMILQPLVENAIRHGITPSQRRGKVVVRIQPRTDRLVMEIRDNGVGFPDGGSLPGQGVGVNNTRRRLEQLYGAAQVFRLESQPGHGVLVAIEIPLRFSAEPTVTTAMPAAPRHAPAIPVPVGGAG